METEDRVAADFEPPVGFYAEFDRLSRQIGAAAYRTWFRGTKAWIKRDGEVMLDCPTPLRARWIREHYAAKLADITGRFVIVTGDAPMTVGTPTQEAWWQTRDIKTGCLNGPGRDIATVAVMRGDE